MQTVPPPRAAISAPAPSSPPASSPTSVTPAAPWIAVPRPWNKAAWLAQHHAFVKRARQGGIDVLFLGDSITANFATRGKDVWAREIAPLGSVADFGISGDRTQFVLWRVLNGEIDGTNARVVVLMIGTNNLGSATPETVGRGVAAILKTVRARLPDATVILNALLPRGARHDPLRAKVAAVNALIAPLADGNHVRWLDAGAAFVDADGAIPTALMPDALHPSPAGYAVLAAALRPLLLDALSK